MVCENCGEALRLVYRGRKGTVYAHDRRATLFCPGRRGVATPLVIDETPVSFGPISGRLSSDVLVGDAGSEYIRRLIHHEGYAEVQVERRSPVAA